MLNKFWHRLFTPDHRAVARQQLAEAKLRLMEAEANAHYATLMITYYSDMIKRHENLLGICYVADPPQFLTEGNSMKQ